MTKPKLYAVRDSSGCTAFFLTKIEAEQHFVKNALSIALYEIPIGKLCAAPAGWKVIL